MLDDILGFSENQLKATCGLGYRLTQTKNSDNVVLNKGNAINTAKIEINSIDWYVKNCTPSIEQQRILMKQIVDKTPTELHYAERSVPMKEVNTQNLWTFELGTQARINAPLQGFVWRFNKTIGSKIKGTQRCIVQNACSVSPRHQRQRKVPQCWNTHELRR